MEGVKNHNIALKLCGLFQAAVLLLAVSALSARAQVTETDNESPLTSWASNSIIQQIPAGASTSLLEAGSSSFSTLTGPTANTVGGALPTMLTGLNDGKDIGTNGGSDWGASAYYAYNFGSTPKANLIDGDDFTGGPNGNAAVFTFNLSLSNSPLGYDINSVDTFAGWTDHASVANQNYTLAYELVGSDSFIPLTSVAYNPNNPVNENNVNGGPGDASEVSLTNLDLTGVAAIQFSFTPDPTSTGNANNDNTGTGIWLQEIQAFGSATTAVPEPATWATMFFGMAALALFQFRRKRLS